MRSSQIPLLLEWCEQNEIWIDPSLQLHDDTHTGIGVFTSDVIQNRATVVKIPKDRVLSSRSCSFSHVLENFKGYKPTLVLSLAICLETQLGASSRWWGYLESLPKHVDIALFWEVDGNNGAHADQAIQWLQGTELEKHITAGRVTTLAQLETFYQDLTASNILRNAGAASVSIQDLRHAYSLVSSRAFKVDAYHIIAMVPIADAFNHVEDNTVHLETDYFVCPHCGSLDECPHDDQQVDHRRQESISLLSARDSPPAQDECEMVTNALILPGDELFNSYDATLSNARLMMQYGFMLEGNSNDRTEWMPSEVDHVLDFGHINDDEKMIRLKLWESSAAISFPLSDLGVDELLFNPHELHHDPSGTHDGDSMADPPSRPDEAAWVSDPTMLLCIGAYAQMSQQLWLYLLFHRLPTNILAPFSSSYHPGVDSSQRILTESIVEPLLRLLVADGEAEEVTHSQAVPENEAFSRTTRLIVDDIILLCRRRLEGMPMNDRSVQELGNLLDSIPPSEGRTRMTCMFSLNERMILESCVGKWEDCRARIL